MVDPTTWMSLVWVPSIRIPLPWMLRIGNPLLSIIIVIIITIIIIIIIIIKDPIVADLDHEGILMVKIHNKGVITVVTHNNGILSVGSQHE